MKKIVICIFIGLFVICNNSTTFAKITSIKLNTSKNTVTFTYENETAYDYTYVWIKVNEVSHKNLKLAGTGTKTKKVTIEILDIFEIFSCDLSEKCAEDKFKIIQQLQTRKY